MTLPLDDFAPAVLAATRRLIGLTHDELGGVLGINPRTLRRWETGESEPRHGALEALMLVRARHDADTAALAARAAANGVVEVPAPDGLRPGSWWIAVGARVLDREPAAVLAWPEGL